MKLYFAPKAQKAPDRLPLTPLVPEQEHKEEESKNEVTVNQANSTLINKLNEAQDSIKQLELRLNASVIICHALKRLLEEKTEHLRMAKERMDIMERELQRATESARQPFSMSYHSSNTVSTESRELSDSLDSLSSSHDTVSDDSHNSEDLDKPDMKSFEQIEGYNYTKLSPTFHKRRCMEGEFEASPRIETPTIQHQATVKGDMKANTEDDILSLEFDKIPSRVCIPH